MNDEITLAIIVAIIIDLSFIKEDNNLLKILNNVRSNANAIPADIKYFKNT
jgi:hypothetical protein